MGCEIQRQSSLRLPKIRREEEMGGDPQNGWFTMENPINMDVI